jgi:hypothetical protein
MKLRFSLVELSIFLPGFFLGLVISGRLGSFNWSPISTAHGQETAKTPDSDLATLRAEIERLKTIVPDQSHVMKDVDYHFTNLWFAGKSKNWPLADFYWKETLAHIKWAVRIIPVRKDNAGRDIKLEEILQAIEMTPSMQMGEVIKDQNGGKFEATYRSVMEGCYLCHKASDKPYLRPQIPERPATSIMNFDPKATWPK